MGDCIIYAAGYSPAMGYCIRALKYAGITILSEPSMQVTHLLLPVPSFTPDGTIVGGGNLRTLLTLLPRNIIVIGGNLDRPELDDYPTVDLLQDAQYLALNAQITAHCAVKVALQQLPVILDGCEVLVIGWGRIGKCLAQLLQRLGANVTVCARKAADRSMLAALGYRAESDKSVVEKAVRQAMEEGKDLWKVKVSVRATRRTDTNDPNYWMSVNGRFLALPADDKYHELPLPFAECLVNTIHAERFVREYADKNIQVYDPFSNPHPNGADYENIRN